MSQRIELNITIAYEVDDEVALRDAAHVIPGRGGGLNYNAGDAALRIVATQASQRLAIPGTRVVASGVTREFHAD